MLIKLVVRTNKIEDRKKPLREHSGEFILWDNCEMVRFASNGSNLPVTKEEFILEAFTNSERTDSSTQYFDGKRKIERTYKMLKDHKVCADGENYHYNIVEWRDRLSEKWYRLIFDTYVFLCDDKGGTLQKVAG